MTRSFTRAALAAILAIGGMAGAATPALAQSLELEIGSDGVRPTRRSITVEGDTRPGRIGSASPMSRAARKSDRAGSPA